MKEKPVVGWAMPTLLQKCEFVFGRPLTFNLQPSNLQPIFKTDAMLFKRTEHPKKLMILEKNPQV